MNIRMWAGLLVAMGVWAASASAEVDATTQPSGLKGAQSVHFGYPAPAAVVFYNEVTVQKSTSGSYFMVCGWTHGYFGIQDHEGGRHNVIFSVWDPGKNDRPEDVPADQRVKVIYKADDVTAGRFGGEGTGGHSGFAYSWKIGETYQFIVTAKTDGNKSDYAGWFFMPETKQWKHLVTFETITKKKGDTLHGLYSFVEDFRIDGKSAEETRQAIYSNGWAMDADGKWTPLLKAKYTGANKPWSDAGQVDAGVVAGGFMLANGGDLHNSAAKTPVLERPLGDAKPPELPPEILKEIGR